jgi:hypothetical protein
MANGGVVRSKSRVGRHPPVVGSGQEVGRGVGRARAVRKEERNGEKEGVW